MFFKKIMFYGENQFLGVKEFFEKKKNYLFTCQVISKKAKFYIISKKDLIKCLNDFPKFKLFFKNKNQLILQNLNKQLENIHKYKFQKKDKLPKLIIKKKLEKKNINKIRKKFQIRSVDWKNRLELSKKRIKIINDSNLFKNISIYANKEVENKTKGFLNKHFPKKFLKNENKKKHSERIFVIRMKKIIDEKKNKNLSFKSNRNISQNSFLFVKKKKFTKKYFSPRPRKYF